MNDEYCTMMVKVHKDDVRNYLTNFYDNEDIEDMNMQDEATECVNEILQNHFSDFCVIGKNTIIIGH